MVRRDNTIFIKVNVPWSGRAFDFVWLRGYLEPGLSASTYKEVFCKMRMERLAYFKLALARLESQDGKDGHAIIDR